MKNLKTASAVLIALFLFYAVPFSQIVQVGAGSYTSSPPPGMQGPTDGDNDGSPISPSITDNITGAVPTNGWGTSLVFQRNASHPHSHTMFPHPLGLETRSDGLAIGYANEHYVAIPEVAGYTHLAHAIYGLPLDLVLGVENLNSLSTKLHDYSDWTQTAAWSEGAFRVTYGHGLPFVYAETDGTPARIVAAGAPLIWHNGGNMLGITIGTRHYGIFAPSGSSWSIDDQTLTSDLGGKQYYSVAVLPDNKQTTLDLFAQHAFAFVRNTEVSWHYDMDRSIVITDFNVETEIMEGSGDQAIMALYYHQWKNSSASLTNHSYVSPRGEMKVMRGNHFSTEIPYTGILPSMPSAYEWSDSFDHSQLQSYVNEMSTLPAEVLIRRNGDTYWTGKEFGRAALLVRIADQIGDIEARDFFLHTLKERLESWFTAEPNSASEIFYHNSEWGVLLGYPSSFNAANGLNDHHFHYGYFIQGAALIAQYDREWASQENWGGMVELIIRNCVNTHRGEGFSPFLRTFDPYAGHSWASGHANFGDGNNQESSSEAINFAASVALWGTVTGNDELRDLGAYLYSTEVEAVQNYWFDVDKATFPGDYPKNAAGMIWGGKIDYATWFSAEPEMIRGINFLPVTGASNYLGHYPEYVLENYAEMEREKGGELVFWRDVLWCYLAYADPQRAAVEFESERDRYAVEEGASRAHTYHHIHNLLAMGQVDRNITADIPNFGVFDNDGEKTYVVYNHREHPVTVTFSDGLQFEIPADTLIALRSGDQVKTSLPALRQTPARLTVKGTNIIINTTQTSDIMVSFYDLRGSRVAQINKNGIQAGTHIIDAGRHTRLANGIYTVSVEAEGMQVSRRISVVR
ncbi:endo-1,3(4)-beta-glucanase [Chitinispirillum alkaliphilum]|nr:endo-1,3(4)-beta-glucanase [Chitinispirillum alkaliphilum]